MMVRAVDAPLELGEVALGQVGRDALVDILPGLVVHHLVSGQLIRERLVRSGGVGVQRGRAHEREDVHLST